jgi:hypothetical protein
MKKLGYWLKRLYLNVRGFLAATLAMFLPNGAPFVRKLISSYLGKTALLVNTWVGLEYDWSAEILILSNLAIGAMEAFATWRAPNAEPTPADKANPVIGTATDLPPK